MDKQISGIADIALNPAMLNAVRLKIMSLLLRNEVCSFVQIANETNATKGNISVQLRKLSALGYITVTKQFQDNYTNTSCTLTATGIKALQDYKDSVNSLLEMIS